MNEFTTMNMSERHRITLRRWDERGVIKPRHDGHKRFYSEIQSREIALLADLKSKGVSLQSGRKVLGSVRGKLIEDKLYVLTNGKKSYVTADTSRIIRAAESMRGGFFLSLI